MILDRFIKDVCCFLVKKTNNLRSYYQTLRKLFFNITSHQNTKIHGILKN